MESNQNLLLIGSSNHTSNIMWCWDEISSLVIREEFDLLICVITLHLFFMVIVFSKVEYWTVAHGGNKGLDFCSTLVTFPSTHRDIALFYVFLLNTCWWYISIELGANRNSTVIYAWMNLSDVYFLHKGHHNVLALGRQLLYLSSQHHQEAQKRCEMCGTK